jgi:hypothetical protein
LVSQPTGAKSNRGPQLPVTSFILPSATKSALPILPERDNQSMDKRPDIPVSLRGTFSMYVAPAPAIRHNWLARRLFRNLRRPVNQNIRRIRAEIN